MSSSTATLDEELQSLFGALCYGLRQEARARKRQRGKVHPDFAVSLTEASWEREVIASLYFHLRKSRFFVQFEAEYYNDPQKRRPDLPIWLPNCDQPLFLEFKLVAWGSKSKKWGRPGNYYFQGARNDMGKINELGDADPPNLPNGLAIVGFSNPGETPAKSPENQCHKLSDDINDFTLGIK